MQASLSIKVFFLLGLVALFFCAAFAFVYHNETVIADSASVCMEKEDAYERSRCLSPYWKALTLKKDAQHAIQKAEAFQKEGIIDDCHLSAHEIGEANYEKFDGDTALAFSSCTMGCIEGCYHGVMEKFIETKGGTDAVVALIPKLCSDIGSDPLLRRQCVHGVGHGLLLHETDDLFIAIEQCGRMSDTSDTQVCNGGVLMEYVHNHITLQDEELERVVPSVCDKVEKERSDLYPLCLLNLGEGLMFATGHNLERSMSLCLLLKVEDQGRCVEGVQEEMRTQSKAAER